MVAGDHRGGAGAVVRLRRVIGTASRLVQPECLFATDTACLADLPDPADPLLRLLVLLPFILVSGQPDRYADDIVAESLSDVCPRLLVLAGAIHERLCRIYPDSVE